MEVRWRRDLEWACSHESAPEKHALYSQILKKEATRHCNNHTHNTVSLKSKDHE